MVKDDFQQEEVNEGGSINIENIKKEKKKIPKKKVGLVIGAVVVVGIIGVGVFISQSNKENFHTLTKGAFSSLKGQFTYTFDVSTSEHKESTGDVEIDFEDIEEIGAESSESDSKTNGEGLEGLIEGATEKQDTENVEWGDAEGIKDGYWKYPNYTITFSGCCNDTENPESAVKISIATDYCKGDFTEVTELGGKTYLNIGMMKKWLSTSGDAYLVSLAEALPDGAYVAYDNFELESRYSDNPEATKYSGYTNFVTRNVKLISGIYSQISNSLGKTGLSKIDKDFYSIDINSEDSRKLASAIKGVVIGAGSIYDGYVNSLDLSEDAKAEALNTKSNVLGGYNDLMSYFTNTSLDDMNMQFSGKANKYLDTKGNTTIDSNFGMSFTLDNTDYVIKGSLSRIAKAGDVTEPLDTIVEFDGDENIKNTLRNVADYFNPIQMIDLAYTSEKTNEGIKLNALKEFAELVNSRGTYDGYLSELNINEYIATYINGSADDENTKLVTEFMQTFNDLTGGLIIEKEVQQEVVQEQYPNITGKLDKKTQILSGGYVEKGSSKGLLHVQLLVLNKEEYERPYIEGSEVTLTPKSVDLTKFTVKDEKNTETNANNEVLLRAFDNNWDMTESPITVYINPEGFATIDLYFTADDFTGKVELFYNGDKIGDIKAY